MKERPEERYEPGELEHTRKNLGDISREESKKLTRLLGGDIGVEKTDPLVEEKYNNLKYKDRREMEETINTSPMEAQPSPSAAEKPSSRPRGSRKQPSSFRYWDRLRTAFLMAEKTYRYKTRRQAVQTLFSLLFPVPDRLNPETIRRIDSLLYRPLEEFTLALKEILPDRKPVVTQALRLKPYSQRVYKTLLSWDMETISHELAQIQRNPRRAHPRDFHRFLIHYCRPLLQLSQLDPRDHVLPALHQIFNCSILTVIPKGPEYQRRRRALSRCIDLYPYLQSQIFPLLYPLLLANFASSFLTRRQLFYEQRDLLLKGLQIIPRDILTPPGPEATGELHSPAKPQMQETSPAGKTTVPKQQSKLPPGSRKGLLLLAQLFPNSGWEKLQEKPDLYPYYQPLYSYEKGTELIPREDPLQPLIILLSLLEDIFPAFRYMELGTIQDEANVTRDLRQTLTPLLENWRFFRETLINQRYLPRLEEYCRQVERTHRFQETRYAKKLAEELSWLKRTFFFPNFFVIEYKEKHPPRTVREPSLYEQTAQLKEIFSSMLYTLQREFRESPVTSLTQFQGSRVLGNPGTAPHFEISNPVSQRMKALLKKPGDNRYHNFSILYFSYNILQLLDTLLNKPEIFYGDTLPPLFRSIRGEGEVPEYTVTLRRTREELHPPAQTGVNSQAITEEEELQSMMQDSRTGLGDEQGFRERLKEIIRQVRDNTAEPETFSLLLLRAPGIESYRELGSEDSAAHLLQLYRKGFQPEKLSAETYLLNTDDLALILPGTALDTAASTIRKHLTTLAKTGPTHPRVLPAQAGLIEYDSKWDSQYFLEQAEKTLQEACRYPPQSLALQDTVSLQTSLDSDLPLTEPLGAQTGN